MRDRMKRKAFFLVFSLWIFLILSFFCLALGFRTRISIQKTKLLMNSSRAFDLAFSGIKIASGILDQDAQDGTFDHLGEDWAKFEKVNTGEESNKIRFSFPKKEASISGGISDESARLNVNKVSEQQIIDLFEQAGLTSPEEKAGYLLDYIDQDEVPRYSDSEEGVKNNNLSLVEEILLIKNISKLEYKQIDTLVTVFGSGKVNINTAAREVLEVLISNDDLKEKVFERRFGSDGIGGTEDDGYYESIEELPQGLSRLFFTVSSDIFRILGVGVVDGVKKEITCIINRKSGKIIYWYEK